jgi:hypothetical protein
MKALIAGSVMLDFAEETDTENQSSYLYWVFKKGNFSYVQAHATRQFKMLKRLQGLANIDTIQEFFGGAGMGTGIAQRLFRPKEHYVYELDEGCIAHLQNQRFSKDIVLQQGDAKDTMLAAPYADLMYCDFAFFNPTRISEWQLQLDHIFRLKPKAVCMNDTSFWSRHLHQSTFAKPLNKEILTTTEDYVLAYSEKMLQDYGYAVDSVYIHRGASFLYMPSTTLPTPAIHSIHKRQAEEMMVAW